jgi:hypothetical protein
MLEMRLPSDEKGSPDILPASRAIRQIRDRAVSPMQGTMLYLTPHRVLELIDARADDAELAWTELRAAGKRVCGKSSDW